MKHYHFFCIDSHILSQHFLYSYEIIAYFFFFDLTVVFSSLMKRVEAAHVQ